MKSLFTAFLFALCDLCFPQAGTIDSTFGEDGKVFTDILGSCRTAALQSDGKILAGGLSGRIFYPLIRYLPDGSLDNSFGQNGIASVDKLNGMSSLELLPSGNIITAGSDNSAIVAVQFKPGGTPDSSFGNKGISRINFLEGPQSAFAVKVQPDGKILLAGVIGKNNFINGLLLRLNSDGTVDQGFGDSGKVINDYTYQLNCVALQTDGKIVTAGQVWPEGAGSEDKFVISRYDSNGKPDNSFGTHGTVFTDISDGNDVPYALSILSDGKILAAGVGDLKLSFENSYMTVAKYNADGTLNQSFGDTGIAKIVFQNKAANARSLLIQDDGKLILGGTVQTNIITDDDDFAMARLKADGTIDSSFGIDGEVVTPIEGIERSKAGLLQADGKIILAGDSQIMSNDTLFDDFLLIRYNNDVALPLHFTYFNAAPTNKGTVALNWQTAQENNNNYFAVQRSADSRLSDNNEIGRVNSQENSSNAQNYSYTDNTPLEGTNFYRLKQVDKDGKFLYSQVVSATIQNGLTVVLYPNPVKDVLNIKGLNVGPASQLMILDSKGNVVGRVETTNPNYQWKLKSLSSGVYYLKVTSDNKTETIKFIKE